MNANPNANIESILTSIHDVKVYPPNSTTNYFGVSQHVNQSPAVEVPMPEVVSPSPAKSYSTTNFTERITAEDLEAALTVLKAQSPHDDHHPEDDQGRDVSWVTWDWIQEKVLSQPIAQSIIDAVTAHYWERLREKGWELFGPHPIRIRPRSSFRSRQCWTLPAVHASPPNQRRAPAAIATVEGLPPLDSWGTSLLAKWRALEQWIAESSTQESNRQLLLIYLLRFANDHVTQLVKDRITTPPPPPDKDWV